MNVHPGLDSGDRLPLPLSFRASGTDLDFAVNERKIVITRKNRPNPPHLCIALRTRSGEVDFHLTRDHEVVMADESGTREKKHEPLFVVTPTMLEAAGHAAEWFSRAELLPFWLKYWRRYRPGWLYRNDYVIVLAGNALLSEVIDRFAPKERGKHRIRIGSLRDPSMPEAIFGGRSYSPQILAYPQLVAEVVGSGYNPMPVTAVPIRGGIRDMILLQHGRAPNGAIGWCGIMTRHSAAFSMRMSSLLCEWLVPRIATQHVDVFDRIVTAMDLDEIEELRPVIANLRRYMKDPRAGVVRYSKRGLPVRFGAIHTRSKVPSR